MQIANAVNEGIQFTANAPVAFQQIILTHTPYSQMADTREKTGA